VRPKFAIVREDHLTEAALVHDGVRRALLVASAGDTLLCLAKSFPELQITAFDFNPAQIDLVRRKILARDEPDERQRLSQDGEFEGLFRVLRHYLLEFVFDEDELAAYFDGRAPAGWLDSCRANGYWSAAFDVAFADPFLHAMFGPAATQHAEPGSYGPYFRGVFERGLRRADGPRNPFLQHALLGRFGPGCEPPWYGPAPAPEFHFVQGSLPDVDDLATYDLVSLSNCLDWADDATAVSWGEALCAAAKPGCTLLLRQLNNTRDVRRFFPGFAFDDARGHALLTTDRSLFYNRIEVAVRR
jgi:S-adenosylmethionine-diacylglycerol 3-amino-3-carboxypropyl transferase